MTTAFRHVLCLSLLLTVAGWAEVKELATINQLSSYNVSSITVSGISSGAYMAVQMHMAYSMIISGAAAFAGGPFYCAEGTVAFAETKCMAGTFGGPNVDLLVQLTYNDAKLNYIDDPSNLKDDKVFVYSGLSDTVVVSQVVHSLQAYYSYFMDASRIETSYEVNSEHCLPTLDYGEACLTLSSPYLGKRGYDGAGAAFATLYGNGLQPRVAAFDESRLFTFDQTPFIEGKHTSIGEVGYIYVPKACEDTKTTSCRLHISFHGCHQGTDEIGDTYARHAGFNQWAENNNIIVLYPMATASTILPLNPNGCWDWWGYTDPVFYGTKTGVQPSFVRRLITAVTGK